MVNKGQRVKVVKETYKAIAGLPIGTEGVIAEISMFEPKYRVNTKNDYGWFTEDMLELIPAEEPKYLTYNEAMKLAIDGIKVQPMRYVGTEDASLYVIFESGKYMLKDDTDGYCEPYGLSFETKDKPWVIYSPPVFNPRFTIGQFFTNESDDYGRVLEITKDGYLVTFNGNRTSLRYTEDKMTEVE